MDMTATLPRVALPDRSLFIPSSDPFRGSGSAVPAELTGIPPSTSQSGFGDRCTRIYFLANESAEPDDLIALIRNRFLGWTELSATSGPIRCHWVLLDRATPPTARILSPIEQLDEVAMTFSLNASQTAEVLNVSRETIYKWRRGKGMGPQNQARLNELREIAKHYRSIDPKPVGPALTWVHESLGESLLGLLRAEHLDVARIRRCLAALPKRLMEHFAEANALAAANANDGWPEISAAWRRETRLYASGRSQPGKETGP